MTIEQLFFELTQVAIGTRICLSHTPSADEWGELYAMAKKQSLIGICFAAVQKLQCNDHQEPRTKNQEPTIGTNPKPRTKNPEPGRSPLPHLDGHGGEDTATQ